MNFQQKIKDNNKKICLGNKEKEEIIVINKKGEEKVEINYDGCCKVSSCDKKQVSKGYCSKHYQHYRNGNLDEKGKWLKSESVTQPNVECKVAGCDKKHFAKGYCNKHYKLLKKGKIVDKSVDLSKHKKCKEKRCNKLSSDLGFCGAHAYHFRVGNLNKDGIWIKEPKRKRNTKKFTECIVGECNNKILAKGLCRKHYSVWIRKKNENWIKERYFNGSKIICLDCKEEFLFCQIDFHHTEEKNFSIGEQINNSKLQSRQDIIKEIDNGEWLCSRCHMNRHNNPELTFYETKADKKRGKSMDLTYREIIGRRGCNCDVCGDILLPRELEFHHRDPREKESRIAEMIGWHNIEAIMKEVDKCDIVCRNCHRLIHYARNEFAGIGLKYFEELFKKNNIGI